MRYRERNLENINKLAPNTRIAALKLHTFAEENGIEILIYETIRTLEQQKINVANGKSQTLRSYHLVGQALDFVGIDKNGKELWNGYNNPDIQIFIKEAKRLKFTWGADWDNDGISTDEKFIDSPHLQFEYKGYGTDKHNTINDSKPSSSQIANAIKTIVPYPGKPLKLGSKGKDVERVQRALKINVTRVFDEPTFTALKEYQKRKKLVSDGVCGQITWDTLF